MQEELAPDYVGSVERGERDIGITATGRLARALRSRSPSSSRHSANGGSYILLSVALER